jgi:hypothetical protein
LIQIFDNLFEINDASLTCFREDFGIKCPIILGGIIETELGFVIGPRTLDRMQVQVIAGEQVILHDRCLSSLYGISAKCRKKYRNDEEGLSIMTG